MSMQEPANNNDNAARCTKIRKSNLGKT